MCHKSLHLLSRETELRTTACAKRLAARMFAKIKFTMARLTNLNFMSGSEFPFYKIKSYNVLGVSDYVVSESLKQSRQTVARSELMRERPKVSIRRNYSKFGILQCRHVLHGERRNRSTINMINRKGSSLTQLANSELSGSYKSQQLLKLKSDLDKGLKAKNLTTIMSDPDFLIASWVRIRSNKGSLTPALTDETLDGIKLSWFSEAAGQMRNGGYKFQFARRAYIPKSNSNKLRPLTMPSPKDKIVQKKACDFY